MAIPQFLVLLTALVTLVALNLFGLFEINPGGRVMGAAGTLASKQGFAGAFFNGVLATILATPCTAPFLGAALGFAFTQAAGIIVLMFVVVGLGLASPYVILSWQPAWLKFLPKPGAWMERFKVAMGFPMLATAVWLFSLIPLHYGRRSLVARPLSRHSRAGGMDLRRVRSTRPHASRAGAGRGFGPPSPAVTFTRWKASCAGARPFPTPPSRASLKEGPDGIDWQRWSPAAVAQARAQGRPVLRGFHRRLVPDLPGEQANRD